MASQNENIYIYMHFLCIEGREKIGYNLKKNREGILNDFDFFSNSLFLGYDDNFVIFVVVVRYCEH